MSDTILPDQNGAELEDCDIFEKFVKQCSEDFDQDSLDRDLTVYIEFLVSNPRIQLPMMSISKSRRFYSTTGGCFDQMPKNALQDHWICVLYGIYVSYVLRSIGNGKFKFVDDCYHGFTHEKAMDMPNLKPREFTIV